MVTVWQSTLKFERLCEGARNLIHRDKPQQIYGQARAERLTSVSPDLWISFSSV